MRIEFSENSLLMWPSALGCLYSGRFFIHSGVPSSTQPSVWIELLIIRAPTRNELWSEANVRSGPIGPIGRLEPVEPCQTPVRLLPIQIILLIK